MSSESVAETTPLLIQEQSEPAFASDPPSGFSSLRFRGRNAQKQGKVANEGIIPIFLESDISVRDLTKVVSEMQIKSSPKGEGAFARIENLRVLKTQEIVKSDKMTQAVIVIGLIQHGFDTIDKAGKRLNKKFEAANFTPEEFMVFSWSVDHLQERLNARVLEKEEITEQDEDMTRVFAEILLIDSIKDLTQRIRAISQEWFTSHALDEESDTEEDES